MWEAGGVGGGAWQVAVCLGGVFRRLFIDACFKPSVWFLCSGTETKTPDNGPQLLAE